MTAEEGEGRAGVGRIEAFSDGVIAIIITIMVLELHAPISERMEQLWGLWPVFVAYVLSYAYVAIYWVNHHRLFAHATRVSNGLLWSNMLLLFTLSLIPFSTSYLGEHHFARGATILYLLTLLLPSVSYAWVQRIVRCSGRQSEAARAYHRQSLRKGLLSTGVYLLGIPLALVTPWLGIACAAGVAMMWILPTGPIDRLFDASA
ncbi:DUF1211 domain-containing protein [Sphingomonas sp. MAH-20]|uniref:DUF1211 domain-containing protein n=1 Tax=Sphingomonas horti TaxID=2682842 RepID=A0A6I4J2L9_9SPHN|nr:MULTISPECIES: TMEM175 family protein [Sphingomonas]MBA2918576.1 DUF1211 domain-containing protein [Sphingomonas sp. CGMCC 1.13658]MVO78607.1 DUF1211 domain-containing protein [Sphingomonas horti]